MLENLLNNAAKYTPVGGSITVCVHQERGEAVIEVIDGIRGSGRDFMGYHDLWVQRAGVHPESASAHTHVSR